MIRPRRSVLFMPGSNARAIAKARTLSADGVILDLEDSVAPQAKAAARAQIAAEFATGGFGPRERIIRINDLQSPWWRDDVAMAAQARPDAILVPKILRPQDLATIGQALDAAGADPALRVWAMIETPLAVIDIARIAACAQGPQARLQAFVIGPNDIALATQMRMQRGRAAMLPLFVSCVLAARAYGVDILDGPYSDFSDATGFAEECAQARDLGFDGKTLSILPRLMRPMPPSRRLKRRWRALARSLRPSRCRRMKARARSASRARWWSGCTRKWRSG